MPCNIHHFLRGCFVLVTVVGFMALSMLHVLTLPQETPRMAIHRLTHVDIAHKSYFSYAPHHLAACSQKQNCDSHKHSSHHHDTTGCSLCPFLTFFVVVALPVMGTILVALVLQGLPARYMIIRGPPENIDFFSPPLRGPPFI